MYTLCTPIYPCTPCVPPFQKLYVGRMARRRYAFYRIRRDAATMMAGLGRGWYWRRRVDIAGKRAAAWVLQCAARCWAAKRRLARKQWAEARRAASVKVQCRLRIKKSRRIYRERVHIKRMRLGATSMQSCFRMFVVRRRFLIEKAAAIRIECYARSRQAMLCVWQFRRNRDDEAAVLRAFEDR